MAALKGMLYLEETLDKNYESVNITCQVNKCQITLLLYKWLYLRTAVSGKENGEKFASVVDLSDLMGKVTKSVVKRNDREQGFCKVRNF